MSRHEFLELRPSVYNGMDYTSGAWYCACGKWQFNAGKEGKRIGGRGFGGRRRMAESRFLDEHLGGQTDD